MKPIEKRYKEFADYMEKKFPEMFSGRYGGFAIGEGWYPIIELLCNRINSHVEWANGTREKLLESNPYNHTIPEAVQPVIVEQIKEKFGGLRFYYQGGDDYVHGLVAMAEDWAAHTCEVCGKSGKSRNGGWIRTLCDEHEEQRQKEYKERTAV